MGFNRNKVLEKAQKCLQKGKTADAIKFYRQVVDNDPTDIRHLLKVGDLEAKIGNFQEAVEIYKGVASHYAKDGFYLKSVAVLKQILRIDPGLLETYEELAALYVNLGLSSEALKQYQIVLKQYEQNGARKKALAILGKMADLEPENTSARVKLAEMFAQAGDKESACEQFEEAAEALKQKQNFQDLSGIYEKMYKLGLRTSEHELAESYLKSFEPKKALEILQQLFTKNPKDVKTLELLVKTFETLEKPEKAKSVLQELIGAYELNGDAQKRDAAKAKLATLDLRSATGSLPPMEAAPAPQTPSSDQVQETAPEPESDAEAASSASSAANANFEVQQLIQYGLYEKAADILNRAFMAHPDDQELLAQMGTVFGLLEDSDRHLKVLNLGLQIAEGMGYKDAVGRIQTEVDRIGGGPASSVESASSEQIPQPDVQPAEPEPTIEANAQEADLGEPVEAEMASADQDFDFGEFEIVDEVEETPVEMPSSEASNEPVTKVLDEPQVETEAPFDFSMPNTENASPSEQSQAQELDASQNHESETPIAEEPFQSSDPLEQREQSKSQVPESEEISSGPSLSDEGMDFSDFDFSTEAPSPSPSSNAQQDVSDAEMSASSDSAWDVDLSSPVQTDEEALEASSGRPEEAPHLQDMPDLPGFSMKAAEPKANDGANEAPILSDDDFAVSDAPPRQTADLDIPNDVSDEDLFDLSSELQDEIHELEEDFLAPKKVEDEPLSHEEVLSEFKKGVSRTVSRDDFQTHYNLGIAYKEMGLLDEAIASFELATKSEMMQIESLSMISLCLVGKKDFAGAIHVLQKALSHVDSGSSSSLGLQYQLAEAFVGNGEIQKGYELFAGIRDRDPYFRDCQRRAKELELDMGPGRQRAAEVESEEEESDASTKNKVSYI